ncbi:hypothetical protein HC031_23065 [Planosporangium thailandense]|uniref:PASTA domain-containing protein n=1 Tax=Planosporangium thailandense TaxID=765197 RepID=A0ABX0Y595_9ACTN|nr:hypothetical protein [Planosporangium thailandense]NJC72575.1 hypothetical protein [Planosporangium thailandense]
MIRARSCFGAAALPLPMSLLTAAPRAARASPANDLDGADLDRAETNGVDLFGVVTAKAAGPRRPARCRHSGDSGTGHPPGAIVTISCSADGSATTGRRGTPPLWDRRSDGPVAGGC